MAERLALRLGFRIFGLALFASAPLYPAEPASAKDFGALLAESHALQSQGWLSRAADLLREAGAGPLDRPDDEAQLLGRLSDLELLRRRPVSALELADRAVSMAGKGDSSGVLAAALIHRGNALLALDRSGPADRAYAQALDHLDADATDLRRAVLINRVHLDLARNNTQGAASTLDRLLADPGPGSVSLDQQLALANLALELAVDGDPNWQRRAFDLLSTARGRAQAANRPRALSEAVGALGRLYQAQGRNPEALRLYAKALFQADRAGAPELNARWHHESARILAVDGRLDAAEAAYGQALVALESIEGALVFGWRGNPLAFSNNAGVVYRELAELLLQRARAEQDDDRRQAYLRRVRGTMETFRRFELQDHFRDQCVARRHDGAARTDLQQVLGHGAATLYPILFHDRLTTLVGFADGRIEVFDVDLDTAQLRAVLAEFRNQLAAPGNPRRLRRSALDLYRWLFEPLRADLDAGAIDTLVVIPDGPLRAIPYAGLFDGQDFLVRHYAFPITPGLDLALRPGSGKPTGRVLLSGLSEQVGDFMPLPGVDQELQQIADATPNVMLLNQSFLYPRIEAEIARSGFDSVVFATHALFTRDPRDSFLLTYDDRISLDALEKLLAIAEPGGGIDLLVLSACETAQGDERAALGLAGAAVKAGVSSVLASLWSVQDRSTAQLVPRFFELRRQRPTLTKAQALRQAQVELMADSRYAHPYYWAPFVLIGDWR